MTIGWSPDYGSKVQLEVRPLGKIVPLSVALDYVDARRLFIPGPLPGLNEIIDARATRYKGGSSGYSAMKKKWNGLVKVLAQSARFPAVKAGYFTYLFQEPNKRRDPSNFVAGGIKIIEDGLQEAGLLDNDGWAHVLGFRACWTVSPKRPGVTLFVHPTRCLTDHEAMGLDEKARK